MMHPMRCTSMHCVVKVGFVCLMAVAVALFVVVDPNRPAVVQRRDRTIPASAASTTHRQTARVASASPNCLLPSPQADARAVVQQSDPNTAPLPHVQDRAVICMVAHGWNAAGYEDATSIKGSRRSMDIALRGILRTVTRRCTIHFYFITGDSDAERIRSSVLGSVRYAPTNITYEFLPLDEHQLSGWMARIGHTPTHRTGAAGNVKFFYPLLLPHEERVLMLDSDVLVGRDVCALWSHFSRFTDAQLFAFAPQKMPMSPTKDNQFNAGVGLLHLGRMRRAGWLQLAAASIQFWHAKGMHPPCCAHGDQSVFHMIRFYNPRVLAHYLPRWWNINKCHRYQNFEAHYRAYQDRSKRAIVQPPAVAPVQCQPFAALAHTHPPGVIVSPPSGENDDTVFVGIVHLGCCKKCKRGHLPARWQRLLDAIVGFEPATAFANASAGGTVQELVVRRVITTNGAAIASRVS